MNALDMINFRRRFGFTQAEAAQALGCSPRAIVNWEKGVTNVPESIALAASAVAFGLPKYGEVTKC